MKIAITGARGTVGKICVKVASEQGHHTIQINRTEEKQDPDIKNTEMRVADAANSYDDLVKAFKGADAVIHMAGIPNPVDKDDYKVHNNNTNASFNALRAAAELGIKRFCLASSVNAIGLAYANQPLVFDYFPIDEKYIQRPTDSYALAKMESEAQADSFVDWFRGMTIASMRIHQVEPRKTVQKEHEEQPESGITQLWGWVSPEATARACILSLESTKFEGRHEVFNIVAPDTTQSTPSKELAKKYYPNAEIRAGLEGNNGFWDTKKAKELLGWEHTEKE